jgi:integrase
MARVTGKFNQLTLAQAAKKPGAHGDGAGLTLIVAKPPSKAVSWVLRYMVRGKARTLGLGPWPDVGLAAARDKAAEARRLIRAEGIDPIDAKRAQRDAERVAVAKHMTFKECAEAFIRDHEAGWKNGSKTADQWRASLRDYAYPLIGSLPVGAIDTALVLKVLKGDVKDKDDRTEGPLWTARPETASRVRTRIGAILDYAETSGFRAPGKNPTAWKGHLSNSLPARSKVRAVVGHAALPIAETPAFMAALRERGGLAARALELTILTAARTNEVLGARLAEIDLDKAVWIIPAERMKGQREHRVPLSVRAVDLLRDLMPEPGQEFVFPSVSTGKPLSNMAMLATLKRMGRGDLTAHGFRSTFRDWAAENGIVRDLAEACLAHAITNKAEAAYLRSDVLERRRPVMQAWADYCAGASANANVEPIRGVA